MIVGGKFNSVVDHYGFVGGGDKNAAGSSNIEEDDPENDGYAAVAGGEQNFAEAAYSFVGGGRTNRIGVFNSASPHENSGDFGVVGGGNSRRLCCSHRRQAHNAQCRNLAPQQRRLPAVSHSRSARDIRLSLA